MSLLHCYQSTLQQIDHAYQRQIAMISRLRSVKTDCTQINTLLISIINNKHKQIHLLNTKYDLYLQQLYTNAQIVLEYYSYLLHHSNTATTNTPNSTNPDLITIPPLPHFPLAIATTSIKNTNCNTNSINTNSKLSDNYNSNYKSQHFAKLKFESKSQQFKSKSDSKSKTKSKKSKLELKSNGKYKIKSERMKSEIEFEIDPNIKIPKPQRPLGHGIYYSSLFKKIGRKLYSCKVCNDYVVTCTGSILKHIRNDHKKRAMKAKYEFQLSQLDSVPDFDYIILNKSKNYNYSSKSYRGQNKIKRKTCNFKIKGYWKCRLCDKVLNTKSGAYRHIRYHSGIKPYICTICFKKFADKISLRNHITIHTGEKPWECHICKKRFRLQNTCVNHVRCHTGEKPYKCHFKGCNKAYKTRTMLKGHIRSHTKEKPFICSFKGCGKAYQTKGGLQYHMDVHKGNNKCQCDLCGRWLSNIKSVRAHKKNVHKVVSDLSEQCDMCNMCFESKWGLKLHKSSVHDVHTFMDYDETGFRVGGGLEKGAESGDDDDHNTNM